MERPVKMVLLGQGEIRETLEVQDHRACPVCKVLPVLSARRAPLERQAR